ncbi:TetR/AcrR family transcriptional regulator [Pseudonocardia nigra]|uniref:TetR/AcrR family transcriptional regulator n=1 Tax=Pseudonocardia nigra TaxID=1921578 RepID=UPI001C5DCA5A|nr:TetR/AcrR family transcriptional regulator [Pseudonocardia nigra]
MGQASSSSRTLREIRSDDTRERLLDAALECFANKGFHATTTRDISNGAGLSPAALYVHFKSKEDLLYQLSIVGHSRILDRIRRAGATGSTPPREKLVDVVRAFVLWQLQTHTRSRVNNHEYGALSPAHRREVSALRRSVEEEMRRLVDAGIASGHFVTNRPDMTAVAILSLGIDTTRWYREDGKWSADEIADHYCDLALGMLGAADRAARPAAAAE